VLILLLYGIISVIIYIIIIPLFVVSILIIFVILFIGLKLNDSRFFLTFDLILIYVFINILVITGYTILLGLLLYSNKLIYLRYKYPLRSAIVYRRRSLLPYLSRYF